MYVFRFGASLAGRAGGGDAYPTGKRVVLKIERNNL